MSKVATGAVISLKFMPAEESSIRLAGLKELPPSKSSSGDVVSLQHIQHGPVSLAYYRNILVNDNFNNCKSLPIHQRTLAYRNSKSSSKLDFQ
jgi:hypothetical protein